MANKKGSLRFSIQFDDSDFSKGILRVNKGIKSVDSNYNKLSKGLKGGAAFYLASRAIGKAAQALSHLLSKGKELIEFQVAMDLMLGGVRQSAAFLDSLNEASLRLGLPVAEVREGAKQLVAFGTSAEFALSRSIRLSEIAKATGSNVKELISAFAKAKTSGIQMEDINKFTERGVPLFEELARVIGISDDQVRKLVERGRVGFEDLDQAIQNLTGEGGRFSGVLESIADTNIGKFNQLKAAIDIASSEFGAGIIEGFDFEPFGDAVDDLKEFGAGAREVASVMTELTQVAISHYASIVSLGAQYGILGMQMKWWINLVDKNTRDESDWFDSQSLLEKIKAITWGYGRISEAQVDSIGKFMGIEESTMDDIKAHAEIAKKLAEQLEDNERLISKGAAGLKDSFESLRTKIREVKEAGDDLDLVGVDGLERAEALADKLERRLMTLSALGGENFGLSFAKGTDIAIDGLKELRDQAKASFEQQLPDGFIDNVKNVVDLLSNASGAQLEDVIRGGTESWEDAGDAIKFLADALENINKLDLSLFDPEDAAAIERLTSIIQSAADGGLATGAGGTVADVNKALEDANNAVLRTKQGAEALTGEYKNIVALLSDGLKISKEQDDLQEKELQRLQKLREERAKEEEQSRIAMESVLEEIRYSDAVLRGNEALVKQLDLTREKLELQKEIAGLSDEEAEKLAQRKLDAEELEKRRQNIINGGGGAEKDAQAKRREERLNKLIAAADRLGMDPQAAAKAAADLAEKEAKRRESGRSSSLNKDESALAREARKSARQIEKERNDERYGLDQMKADQQERALKEQADREAKWNYDKSIEDANQRALENGKLDQGFKGLEGLAKLDEKLLDGQQGPITEEQAKEQFRKETQMNGGDPDQAKKAGADLTTTVVDLLKLAKKRNEILESVNKILDNRLPAEAT